MSDELKPADLPFEEPTRFRLAINLKAAKAIDLTFPDWLITRADEVNEHLIPEHEGGPVVSCGP